MNRGDTVSLAHFKDKYSKHHSQGFEAIRFVPVYGSGAKSDTCNGPAVKTMANSLLRLNLELNAGEPEKNSTLGGTMNCEVKAARGGIDHGLDEGEGRGRCTIKYTNNAKRKTDKISCQVELGSKKNTQYPRTTDIDNTACQSRIKSNMHSATVSSNAFAPPSTPRIDYYVDMEYVSSLSERERLVRELNRLKKSKFHIMRLLDNMKEQYRGIKILDNVNNKFHKETPEIRILKKRLNVSSIALEQNIATSFTNGRESCLKSKEVCVYDNEIDELKAELLNKEQELIRRQRESEKQIKDHRNKRHEADNKCLEKLRMIKLAFFEYLTSGTNESLLLLVNALEYNEFQRASVNDNNMILRNWT